MELLAQAAGEHRAGFQEALAALRAVAVLVGIGALAARADHGVDSGCASTHGPCPRLSATPASASPAAPSARFQAKNSSANQAPRSPGSAAVVSVSALPMQCPASTSDSQCRRVRSPNTPTARSPSATASADTTPDAHSG